MCVPLGMKWACVCAGNGCCVWLCEHVLVCDSLRRVVGCLSVGVDALAVVWW